MGQSESTAKPGEAAGSQLKAEYNTYQSLFSQDEKEELKGVFDGICKHGGEGGGGGGSTTPPKRTTFTEDQFKNYLTDKLDGTIVSRLFKQMWLFQGAFSKASAAAISYEAFFVVMAKLLKGTTEETSLMVCCLATENAERLVKSNLAKFIIDILSSYERVLTAKEKMGGWILTADIDSKQKFVDYALQGIEGDDGNILDGGQVHAWLEKAFVFYSLLTDVFQVLFHPGGAMHKTQSTAANLDEAETLTDDMIHHVPTLPICKDAKWGRYTTMLDLPTLLTLNYQLPHELRREWRFLYSTALHGSSFSTFLSHIQKKGPTIIMVRDTEGRVFGGFASESWHLGPNFLGNTHCFLFNLTPDLRIYETTAHNDHYMYLNIDQQTMPNGLGMGGQFDFFGLWIDQDYGKGHSRAKPTCSTYDSPQLSGSENFVIDCIEVWAVGPMPKKQKGEDDDEVEGDPKSILDKDPSAEALLELAGRPRLSEGLREVEDDPKADIPGVHALPPLS